MPSTLSLKFHTSGSQISKGRLPNYHPMEGEAQEDQVTNRNEEQTLQRNQKALHKEKAGTAGNVISDSCYDAGNNHIPVTCSLLPHKGIWIFPPKMWDTHYSVWLGCSHASCRWRQYTPQNARIPTTWCTAQLYDKCLLHLWNTVLKVSLESSSKLQSTVFKQIIVNYHNFKMRAVQISYAC